MALKKWSSDGKPSAIFATTHKDRTGGGELYAHQIAKQLDGMCDLRYFTGNGGTLHREFSRYHGIRHRFTSTALLHATDIFVSCSHFIIPQAVGKNRNVLLTFFPNPDHKNLIRDYDTVVTCSNFSATWVKKYWGKTAKVIYPYIDLSAFNATGTKAPKTILNVGRFFREPHGHSKRQDALIEAFAVLHRKDPEWSLVLAGSVLSASDRVYLEFCKSSATNLGVREVVEFCENVDFDTLRGLYSNAEVYWHANGYESKNPYETEHFGIVIAEAMASGCTPIIFKGGGYSDFPADAWTTTAELVKMTLRRRSDPEGLRAYVEKNFSETRMNADVYDLFFRRKK